MGVRQRKRLLQRRKRAEAVARSGGRQRAVMTGAAFTAAGVAVAGLAVVPASGVAPSGAELVADLEPGRSSSSPRDLVAVGDELFFTASTYIDEDYAPDVWRVKAGSAPQRITLPGVTSTPRDLTNVDGILHFRAYDNKQEQVWRLDGSTVQKITDFAGGSYPGDDAYMDSSPRDLTAVGGTLFFTAGTPEHGLELWKSAGGPATVVRDFTPGAGSTNFDDFEAAGDRLFFTAGDRDHNQLWVAPSRGAGATQVTNLVAPEGDEYYARAESLTAVGDTLFFRARDASTGAELWKSDGTAAGTTLVRDIDPGASSSWPTDLVAAGNKLYFTASGPDSRGLWETTGSGSTMVLDLGESYFSSNSTVAGGTLFFTRFADEVQQLWRLNGSALQQLTTFPAGSSGVESYGMAESGGNLYFPARDGEHGEELWVSDGTVAGTGLVADIRPKAYGSEPYSLTDVAGTLYFAATDDTHGRELWRTTGRTPTPTPTSTPTPAPTPSPTVTPLPTGQPTPTPTVSPTPTATPSPTGQPTPTPTPTPTQPAPVDRSVSGFKASAKKQKVGKKIGVKVKAGAGERVTLKLTTTVKIKGQKGTLKLKTATVNTSAGQQKTVSLKASKSVTKKLLKALKRYRAAKSKKARAKRAVTATVTIRATDSAGNVKTRKVKIRLS